MRTRPQFLLHLCLLCIVSMELGCAVRLKPVIHSVPYQSEVVCAATNSDCPWVALEEQAKFSALINCLLSGATALETETSKKEPLILVPTPPKFGYEFVINSGNGRLCSMNESACVVTSRTDNQLTWAGCGSAPLANEALRGGMDIEHADPLKESSVISGSLAASTNSFLSQKGLDGPDQFYTFTLTEKTYVETAIAANSSQWSPTKGHRAPWQPGLFLLAPDGQTINDGQVWKAGVTYLLPQQLDPGTYYLVVDSSQREFIRGDGRYRLYLGLNKTHMGGIRSP